jgi:hypothetical protein
MSTETKTTILERKVTGSLFIGVTWAEFANKINDFFIPQFTRPILFIPSAYSDLKKGKAVSLTGSLQEQTFGKGDQFWNITDNLQELKANYPHMEGSFYIRCKDKGRTLKTLLPKEVIELVIQKL